MGNLIDNHQALWEDSDISWFLQTTGIPIAELAPVTLYVGGSFVWSQVFQTSCSPHWRHTTFRLNASSYHAYMQR